eukprot:COSAG06_NODE_2055_length_7723_cov_6.116212_4_plen_170_part_00
MEESEPPRRRSSRSSRRARARAWKTEGSALELVRDLTWPKLAPCQHSVICPRHFSPLEKNATRRSLITKICPRGKCPHELARHRGRAPPPRCRALEPVGVATRATRGPTPRTGARLGRARVLPGLLVSRADRSGALSPRWRPVLGWPAWRRVAKPGLLGGPHHRASDAG